MKILLTGATGLIGSAVLSALVADGHRVTAVVRSQASSLKVSDQGATGVIGDLFDAPWLASELRGHDGFIHTAAGGDDRDPQLNDAVITAALDAFAGTDKPFVHTGGIWSYGSGTDLVETADPAPPSLTAWRPAGEQRVLESGLRASVVQPGIVYGHGAGIPAMLVGGVDDGTLTLVGSGDQHWAAVHVDDLADLYVRALTNAPGGKAYIAASGDNPTVRELGEAVADTVVPESDEETVARLGPFGEALLLDQQATGQRAKSELGWQPSRPTLVELLAKGYSTAG
ncbi:NAD-dependent epimerase/dehydratase family protein [Aeromicrobium fastidiosum]|uniref:NAD(P)H-binding protein n=1 Tax=Aeromicrobium fastidiosum TaxID=52699 RepID=A0A641AHY9_9ACTN|nr:NAD-dependent epimerase/dehydratase family protein [Aeromicrobium fastidiosum]KAA1373575.1 NAD(P)H-binding protein [Aeromicrobium fastidiosum]MBP2391122.1 nucleoside-diphosphate-sugar epimerase [Aeromicrobium fastidiosum]